MNKQRIVFLIKVFVSISLVSWFLVRTDVRSIFNAIAGAHAETVVVAGLLAVVVVILDTVQWHVLLPAYRFADLLKANLVSKYYSLVLPGQLAGELGKVLHLKGRGHMGEITASVIVDKLAGLVGAVGVVGTVGALENSIGLPPFVPLVLFLSFVVTGIGFFLVKRPAALHLFAAFLVRTAYKAPFLARFARSFADTIGSFASFPTPVGRVFAAIALGVGFQVVTVLMVLVIANGAGVFVGFFDWCWILALLSIVLLLPISIGGLGLREMSLVSVLSLFGVSSAHALVVSFGIFGIQIALALVGFAIVLVSNKKRTEDVSLRSRPG